MSDRALVTFKSDNNFSPYIYIKEDGGRVIDYLKEDISILQQLGGGMYAAGHFVWSFSNRSSGHCLIGFRNGPPLEALDWDPTAWVENAPAIAEIFVVDIDAGEVSEYFWTIDPSGKTCDIEKRHVLIEEDTAGSISALVSLPVTEDEERAEQETVSDSCEAIVGEMEENDFPRQEKVIAG